MKGAKLRARLLDDATVLIEGDAKGLEMLGWMLLAMAGSPARSFAMTPEAQGSAEQGLGPADERCEMGLQLRRMKG